jgi:hypothetical protein
MLQFARVRNSLVDPMAKATPEHGQGFKSAGPALTLWKTLHRRAMRALREHEAGMADYPALRQAAMVWLGDHRASLVGELPRRVEGALRQGDYADRRFAHVIVDEFQDLTDVEARLAVALRAHGGHRSTRSEVTMAEDSTRSMS